MGVQNHVEFTVRDRVLEFLAQYGERGLAVLKAAVEAALASRGPGVRLGDFSYRDVVAKLRSWGLSYNPSMLLRILERDYGVIETSYRSSNQHWWRFVSLEEVVEALEAYEKGVDATEAEELEDDVDPEVELLRLQIASLDLPRLKTQLYALLAKKKLTRHDLQQLRRLAFGELSQLTDLLRKAMEYEELEEEVRMMKEILSLASKLARKLLIEQRAEARSVAVKSLTVLGNSAGAALDES